ncbi:energy transducer TonB [Lacinutrix algicola]|uniref:energy transducer TonB n=1 Tax=Lacinutrix algicola TaxID=342954 RepID=UPI0006E3F34F|nr:energy transducer TonB [Lacinutrix algicola]
MKNSILILLFISLTHIVFSQDISSKSLDREEGIVDFNVIEHVPIYKGCDKKSTNSALKKCMSDAVNKHVLNYFNANIGDGLGLQDFKVKIYSQFTIDIDGTVTNIKIRGPHPKIEKEARRVINLIPTFTQPGMQLGKPVKVTFSLPITFNIKNKKKTNLSSENSAKDLDSFPIHKRCDESLGLNSQRECTTQKIVDFIKMSVNMELADKLFPLEKSTKFQLDFIIDKKGKIKDITAKAHHKVMAAEAIRVAKRLPKLKAPGFKNGKPVEVPISVLMTIYF